MFELKKLSIYFAVIYLLLHSSVVFAVVVQEKSYAVPVKIDLDNVIKTSLYIKFKVKQYGVPFNEFLAKEQGEKEKKFQNIIIALNDKDVTTLKQLSSSKISSKEVEKTLEVFNRFLESVTEGKIDKMQIVNSVYLGKRAVLIWGVDKFQFTSNIGPLRRPLIFDLDSNDDVVWDGSKADPLSILVNSIMQCMADNPKLFVPLSETVKFDYEVPIPNTTLGHTVYLQFNGKVYNVDVFKDKVNSSDPVLNFYLNAYKSFQDEKLEMFADFYTERSKAKYLKALSETKAEMIKDYHDKTIENGRIVRFVLNADPFYIVFYSTCINKKELFYEYVVRDPKDGKLKLTNFCFFDLFDNFLNDKENVILIVKKIVGIDTEKEKISILNK